MMDKPAFLLMDIAGWIDRDVWGKRRLQEIWGTIWHPDPSQIVGWCVIGHEWDGWKPARYV